MENHLRTILSLEHENQIVWTTPPQTTPTETTFEVVCKSYRILVACTKLVGTKIHVFEGMALVVADADVLEIHLPPPIATSLYHRIIAARN